MIYAVWLPLLAPLFAVPALRHVTAGGAPVRAARILVVGTVLLACCSTVSVSALAVLGVLQLGPVAAAFALDPRHLPGHTSPALWAAPVALALLLTGIAQVARTMSRHHREVRADQRTVRPTGTELSVRPDEFPYAYALPGRRGKPGHIVVSSAMLRSLPPGEREALFAHERAHLAGQHHRFLAAGQLAARLHPALLGLREPLAYALERWADEDAARAVGDRGLAARAIGRAALAAHDAKSPAARRGAILATAGGAVPRRVRALIEVGHPAPSVRRRVWRATVAAGLVCCFALTAATAADSVEDLHLNVRRAQAIADSR
ncbi:M56 family metallopeptidase [Streptomyces sp. NPDC050085]|uniref:M56 family metallopeptidase n=1 Tax=Streptomyces sp. NPDC050085 TaxID=3365600 RepID=UPI003799399E